MKKIKIIIERTKDMYSAYAENVEGIYGGGDNVAEAKKSILEAIRLTKKYNKDENIPNALKSEYELVYKYDTQSFFDYYKGLFTLSGLERLTGINQRQLQRYSTGKDAKPHLRTIKKIESAVHKLGCELSAVEL